MEARIEDDRKAFPSLWMSVPKWARFGCYALVCALAAVYATMGVCALMGGMPWALWNVNGMLILAGLVAMLMLLVLCFRARGRAAGVVAGVWAVINAVTVLPTAKWDHIGGWWPVIVQPAASVLLAWKLLHVCITRLEPKAG